MEVMFAPEWGMDTLQVAVCAGRRLKCLHDGWKDYLSCSVFISHLT